MIRIGINIKGSKIIVLGLTFKENCSDLRNSKVSEVVYELQEFGCEVHVHDPLASANQAKSEYGIKLEDWTELPSDADVIIAAVSHDNYTKQPIRNLLSYLKEGGVFIDIKAAYSEIEIKNAGIHLWRL